MLRLRRIARHSAPQFAVVLVAAGTWLIGCGDDAKPGAPRGKGGSAGMAGAAGTGTGGTGGSAGSPAGGTGGSAGSTGGAMAGSAGTATGGSAGSAGTAGDANVGGEGGDNQAGGGGTGGSSGAGGTAGADQGGQGGEGGEGGASASVCLSADLDVELISATGTQRHDHLPINGAFRTTLLNMINTGSPLTYTLPEEGMNTHDHTLTFTARQLNTLRNGGALAANVTTSTGGPNNNQHTHTYAIDCEP